jgi:hypothetical protein
MTLEISNSAYMLFMTIFILITLYGVTFTVRALYIIEWLWRQTLFSNKKRRWKKWF